MINRRIFRNAIFAIFSSATLFAACGGDSVQSPTEAYCTRRCNCEKCQPEELTHCNDDTSNLSSDARAADCQTEFDAYLECMTKDVECVDGLYDDSVCYNEETDLKSCINPPAACASTNNGICDEPAPLGTGKCAAGSDKNDCGGQGCPTVDNGICDEPAPLGTGNCPAGTDTLDCNGGVCNSTNDGVCDEPGGTGTCPTGTDANDCYCPYKNNGQCDEPQGSGLCPQGSDPVDCAGGGCPTTNDGVCDEPQGTGNCPAGTDTADCSMACILCADYLSGTPGTLCAASAPLADAFDTCMCNGGCASSCANDYCAGSTPGTACATCAMSGACSTQFNACAADQ